MILRKPAPTPYPFLPFLRWGRSVSSYVSGSSDTRRYRRYFQRQWCSLLLGCTSLRFRYVGTRPICPDRRACPPDPVCRSHGGVSWRESRRAGPHHNTPFTSYTTPYVEMQAPHPSRQISIYEIKMTISITTASILPSRVGKQGHGPHRHVHPISPHSDQFLTYCGSQPHTYNIVYLSV